MADLPLRPFCPVPALLSGDSVIPGTGQKEIQTLAFPLHFIKQVMQLFFILGAYLLFRGEKGFHTHQCFFHFLHMQEHLFFLPFPILSDTYLQPLQKDVIFQGMAQIGDYAHAR